LILCEKEFKSAGTEVHIATDNGSYGYKGNVTEPLEQMLDNLKPEKSQIFTCGSRPMMKEVQRIAKKYGISSQAAMESRMACGIGNCLGCVISLKGDGYDSMKRVCKDGPVFDLQEIDFESMRDEI